jgi:hypothetical protein
MKTVIHTSSKITKAKMKLYNNSICEYCTHLEEFKSSQALNHHQMTVHSGHFKDITEQFYHYVNLLADERFQMAVEEIKAEIAGQEKFVVFLNASLKVIYL